MLTEIDLRRLDVLNATVPTWTTDQFVPRVDECSCEPCDPETCEGCECTETGAYVLSSGEQALILAMRDALSDLIKLARQTITTGR